MSINNPALPAALPPVPKRPKNAHREYDSELRRRLPAHCFQPVPYRALWIVPYWAVVALGILVITFGRLPLFANLVFSLVIGVAFSALGFLGHEIIHGGVAKRRWAQDVLGGICMVPSLIAPALWRKWHNVEHHNNTQITGKDPDTYSTYEQYEQSPALKVLYRLVPTKSVLFLVLLAFWFTVHAAIELCHALTRANWTNRVKLTYQTLIPVGFWIILGSSLGWSKFLLFYGIPALVGNFIVMSYIATNHLLNPLQDADENDPLATSLSVTVPWLFDVIHSNFSHHAEHHIYPAMSTKYMPMVKREIERLWPDRYHVMPLWKAVWTLVLVPRLYLTNIFRKDPITGEVYGSLGQGLDPDNVAPLDVQAVA